MQQTNLCTAQNRHGKDCMAAVPAEAPLSMCMKHIAIIGKFWEQNKDYIGISMYTSGPEMEAFLGRKQVGHGDQRLPDDDVVYYLIHGNRIKIGTSGRWRKRIKTLPHDRLLALEPGDIHKEKQRHRQFEGIRCGLTEWFDENESLWDHILQVNDDNPQFDEEIRRHNSRRARPTRIAS